MNSVFPLIEGIIQENSNESVLIDVYLEGDDIDNIRIKEVPK